MCGIGGILRREPGEVPDQAAVNLLRALSHRGPDDRGTYTSPEGRVSLVHARLAIIDRSAAGHQPMARSGLRITFNGEIYNFCALRAELEQAGEIFVSGTDTEVVLALYARHGPDCLARLRGMFAFAIWDEREGSCFLARDRFGIKPLYYGFSMREDLVFASEVKALMATGMIERRLDPAGLESFLANGSVAEPLTMLERVRCLEAGHWMRWRDGSWETGRYFQVNFQAAETTRDEAREQAKTALLDSVRHHFVGDVPVGIFLSGGLDSGALVALARECGERDLTTFSIGIEDAGHDEAEAARARAEFFGTRHFEMLLTRELAGNWVEPFLDALDQPTVDGFNTYCVSKLASDHGYRVVLSGVGGDELFGGYPSFRRVPELLKIGRALHPIRGATAPLARAWERRAKSGRGARMAAFLQGQPALARAYEASSSIFSAGERGKIADALLGEKWQRPPGPEEEELQPADWGDGISCLELTRYLRNQLLRDADVMSMAHGLELRVPFLDHELWNVLRTIPSAIRLCPGKELLRRDARVAARCGPQARIYPSLRCVAGHDLERPEGRSARCAGHTARFLVAKMGPDCLESLAQDKRLFGLAGMNFSPRVLHVIPSISPKRGGPSEAIMPMVRALNTLGVRAEIATTNDDGAGVRDVSLNQLTEEEGVPVRCFHRFSPPVQAVREYAYAHAFRAWLRKHVRDYDLVHVHALFSHLSTSAMGIAKHAGVPYVNRPLGLLGRWPLRQSAWRKRLYLALGEGAHLRSAAALHFTSEAEQSEAADIGLNLRGVVIPHGVDLPEPIPDARERLRARLALPREQKIVLFLGRLHRKKGLDLLVEAFAGLGNRGVSLVLAGAGERSFERELDLAIRRNKARSRIIRTGFVSGEGKQLMLQGSDILALTSRHENFGMAVLEALAAGTPVLVSNQVALAREVERFGLGMVVSLNAEQVRAGLIRMLDRPRDWERPGLREFVGGSYSWPVNARELRGLYASILKGKRLPNLSGLN